MVYCVYKLIGVSNGLVYYGSTKHFKRRVKEHRIYKRYIKEQLGDFNYEIVEDNIPYKHIAVIREGYYVKWFDCINKRQPDGWWFTINQKDYSKNYYRLPHNKEKHRINNRKNYLKHRDKILEDAHYRFSYGGSINNLLFISPDIFK